MSSENPYQSPQTEVGAYEGAQLRSHNTVLATFFSFEGRIPRRVYWGASLAALIVFYSICLIPMVALGEESPISQTVTLMAYIPMLWSSLAIQTKRWHDRGKSGRWILVNFIPVIGGIWSLIEIGFLRGTRGSNRYGPDPT